MARVYAQDKGHVAAHIAQDFPFILFYFYKYYSLSRHNFWGGDLGKFGSSPTDIYQTVLENIVLH